MATLYASGKTYYWRKIFKLNGFKWEPNNKEWVHQNLNKNEIYRIIALCSGSRIKFHGFSKKGAPLQLEYTTSKGQFEERTEQDHNITSMKSIGGSKFYSPGYSATNAPKPYARKISYLDGNRD